MFTKTLFSQSTTASKRLLFRLSNHQITSKSVRIYEHGSATDVLKVENHEISENNLQNGQILIKNEFAGLNFIDTYQRSGLYKIPLPNTLGVDGAGIIHETTAQAEQEYNLKKGDRISYYDLGSNSEYKVLAGAKAIPIPDNVKSELAVAGVVQGMTAHYLSRSTFNLTADNTCVIHAAAGGVGQILTQIAKHVIGCSQVITTASSAEKQASARKLGADYCVNYQDLEACVNEVTNGKGVDVVYDGVGLSTYQTSMKVLKTRGMCVLYGNASGAVPPIDPLLLAQSGSIFVTRCTLPHYTLTRDELLMRANDLFGWLAEGKIRLNIDRVFGLDDVIKAHEYIEAGLTTGKVLFDCQN